MNYHNPDFTNIHWQLFETVVETGKVENIQPQRLHINMNLVISYKNTSPLECSVLSPIFP